MFDSCFNKEGPYFRRDYSSSRVLLNIHPSEMIDHVDKFVA